ncbi:hypothetical protein DFH06DRAFT_1143772 [Mycena polygramma]|nr:hypothetical protein DFH06DRAFT_1143772 [Mycena polygramma]
MLPRFPCIVWYIHRYNEIQGRAGWSGIGMSTRNGARNAADVLGKEGVGIGNTHKGTLDAPNCAVRARNAADVLGKEGVGIGNTHKGTLDAPNCAVPPVLDGARSRAGSGAEHPWKGTVMERPTPRQGNWMGHRVLENAECCGGNDERVKRPGGPEDGRGRVREQLEGGGNGGARQAKERAVVSELEGGRRGGNKGGGNGGAVRGEEAANNPNSHGSSRAQHPARLVSRSAWWGASWRAAGGAGARGGSGGAVRRDKSAWEAESNGARSSMGKSGSGKRSKPGEAALWLRRSGRRRRFEDAERLPGGADMRKEQQNRLDVPAAQRKGGREVEEEEEMDS